MICYLGLLARQCRTAQQGGRQQHSPLTEEGENNGLGDHNHGAVLLEEVD